MNIALWIFLFLYDIYWACREAQVMYYRAVILIPYTPIEFDRCFMDGFLLLSAIVIFSLRPFRVSKLVSCFVESLLVLLSIILIPIAIYKRQNVLTRKCWMIMPASVLVAILLCIVHMKIPHLMDYYFNYTLGLGCVISFSYSLVQNAIHIIRKVLKA